MAKRGASSELNDRNWDDEEEPEEAGVFVQADKETLQTRVIKRAKRRGGAGSGDGEASKPVSAFSGFGGLAGGTKQPSLSGFAGLKPSLGGGSTGGGFSAFQNMNKSSTQTTTGTGMTFGGVSTSLAAKVSTVNGSGLNNNGTSSEGGQKKGEAYYTFLKSLNQSVLAWIKQHVEENPYIILTPVFKDYEKYLQQHEAQNSSATATSLQSSTNTSSPASKMSNVATEKIDSRKDSADSDKKVGGLSLFSVASLKKSEESSAVKVDTAISTKANIEEAPKPFTFGSGGMSSSSSGGFNFSGTSSNKLASLGSTATTSSFGTSGFSFGSTSTTASSGFSFATTTSASSGTSGFSFGTTTTSTAEKSGFSFGTTTTSTAGNSGFSFGAAAKQAAQSGASSSAGANGTSAEDDEYVPPKPEVKEIREEDALYSKRCKLYFQRNDQWVDRGVGNVHLKPVGDDKTQILIRADTNLGNILLNVMLSQSMPVSRQGKNNVFLVCVPNPPIDPNAAEADSKPVPMLVRVKTGEDADELFNHIEKRKELLS